jgi:hypothetical protein
VAAPATAVAYQASRLDFGVLFDRPGVDGRRFPVDVPRDLALREFAELGYWEGLRTLQEIAEELGLRSAAHVSNLVRRCREQRRGDPDLQKIVEDCLELARKKAPPLPEHYLARVPI